MVRAAERSGKPLMEALHYRFHAVMLKAISLVRGGALGRLLRAQAVFEAQVPPEDTLWRGDLGCGALTDLGCYPIHALRTLLGEPEVVAASARVERGAFAEVDAHLSFAGGVIGRMRASMISPGRQWWLRIEGERGHMEISNFIVPHLFSCELSTQIDGVPAVEQPVGATTYEAQLDHVVDVLARGVPMLTGGADAIANMAVIDAIRAAAGSGGQPMAGLIPTGR
jgi:predicted dehydrogenase